MCSLFGFLDYQGIIPHKVLRKLTQALANAAEERGTDAAGITFQSAGRNKSCYGSYPHDNSGRRKT